MNQLIETIRNAVIGSRLPLRTPFGDKPLVYADYTASGRSLDFIEDYIREQVLPWYANTHTETSFTGAQTTALREQARQQIRRAVNGGAGDKVIFCGPGATAAINRLVDILNLRLPRELSDRYALESRIAPAERPVVFIGPYEHHSNELPWRESIADVVPVPLTACGQIDLQVLSDRLAEHADRPLLIGSFSAASNVTGVRTDVAAVTRLLKRHGALVLWDYAAAAPYVGIDMQGEVPIDAAFISPHKFIGGPGTPGVLVVKQSVLRNSVPAIVGGGTVKYVTPEDHCFIEDHERREEGGTPAIVESIRAGLVFKLQQEVGSDEIERREQDFLQRALARFRACPGIEILGNPDAPRLSIMSLRFRHGDRDLHYGFVVSLLNDLFGIQVRGGCSCAGPYGHSLLGMGMDYSRAVEKQIQRGAMVLRPGWVRLNFNYFIDEEEFEYLLRAVELVAEYGWRMLPYYAFDETAAVWRFQGQAAALVADLDSWSFADASADFASRPGAALPLDGQLAQATHELTRNRDSRMRHALELSPESERLRWFLLPQEAALELDQEQARAC
ncbi:aminotransferase class V-fold PLP-dependent enzyme [Seongchinamella sediminis]|uniref:Aminotransferase class V-fold PLP-dependent enzyme n=1 Tax=Seongchinamella sediminis TaxID=2283635 RepID=A0A3L7DX42_9GAMM|nr:aminotransferase class V-fold PLP-dependent enzyme [Seongchinamella sediminis]RLQ21345.1 aminotransferase class V-fold PLP-dependent enzyme [Seongchinamella sediminis]